VVRHLGLVKAPLRAPAFLCSQGRGMAARRIVLRNFLSPMSFHWANLVLTKVFLKTRVQPDRSLYISAEAKQSFAPF
jgi:hypothetical protein